MTKSRARKHTKASKPFTCNHCERSFPHETSLEQHFRDMHPGLPIAYTATVAELPPKSLRYSCRSCSQTFATIDGLRNHVQAGHRGIKMEMAYAKDFSMPAKPPETSSEKSHHNCLNYSERFEVKEHLRKHSCGMSGVRLDCTGKPVFGSDEAVEVYANMIDMGFAITHTPATDFLCGLEALAISLKAVRKLYGHKRSPSVDDLKSTLYSKLYAIMISDHLFISPELDSANNLTYEQLSVILQIKSIELGVNYRLGITQIDATKTTLILLGEEGQAVWLHNSGGQYDDGETDQRMGHWSGYSNLSEPLLEPSLVGLGGPLKDLNESLGESDGSLEEWDESFVKLD